MKPHWAALIFGALCAAAVVGVVLLLAWGLSGEPDLSRFIGGAR